MLSVYFYLNVKVSVFNAKIESFRECIHALSLEQIWWVLFDGRGGGGGGGGVFIYPAFIFFAFRHRLSTPAQ